MNESHRPLSQVDRVANAFTAPSETFADVLRSTAWWLPFLLLVLVSLAVTVTIDHQVGFERVAENQVHSSPRQEEALNRIPPEQRMERIKATAFAIRFGSYGSPLFMLLFSAVGSLILWGSFNFGLGANTTYGQMFAVWMYASLPRLLTGLLTILTLPLGSGAEGFNLKDPVGTNVGYYLTGVAPWLKTALSFFDVIGLWNLALLIIGTAIVARVKVGPAFVIVIGWWLFVLLLSVGASAAFN